MNTDTMKIIEDANCIVFLISFLIVSAILLFMFISLKNKGL